MLQFRLRLISAVLALVSIGLLASLLSRTSFVAQSSGEVVDGIGPVWPGFAVEQVIDDAPGVISEVRIWAAASFDRGEAPISASLLRRADGQLVRQVKARLLASKVLVPYVLDFPPHELAPNEQLVLQLWVSTERENSVTFGTTEPTGDADTIPTLYGRPTDQGPLAYEVIWRGTGWQAAREGSIPDLARLAGAFAAAAVAATITVLLHPPILRTLRKTTRRVRTAFLPLAGAIQATRRLARGGRVYRTSRPQTPAARRGFYLFPWLIPAFAILHYLSNNLLLFRVSESIAVFVVTMAAVTIALIALRLIFKNAAIAAVITGLLGIAFFSYGHIHTALGERADDRYLLGLGAPMVVGLGALVLGRVELARKIGLTLNVASVVLVVLPVYQIALDFRAGSSPPAVELHERFPGLDRRLAETKERLSRDELRDIYYIILDEYPRSGSPPEFDNSEFTEELESRGFYVDPQARSNYRWTSFSIPSSLNMYYVHDEFSNPGNKSYRRLAAQADDHALGRILKTLGYRYVHVSSGIEWTNTSRNANIVVDFTPASLLLSGDKTEDPFMFERATSLLSRFTDTFLWTTAARPFLSSEFDIQPDDPFAYPWQHPFRTLAWLDFMKEVARMEGPKFVFAHLLKPHGPYSFDRHGNITFDSWGWRNEHDPTLPEPFYGQVIWLNARMLEVIDAILDDYEEPPIIVIASDHGFLRNLEHIPYAHDILAAYLLPDGGESALYPSITSVNHFRAILDYYFELNLGLLEDRVYN